MRRWQNILFGSLWIITVGFGMAIVLAYSYNPGREDNGPPKIWPLQSRVDRTLGKPGLVLFIHPKCPCTRATLTELSTLMAHCQSLVTATILVATPAGADSHWADTDLCKSAAAIPGVTIRVDEGERETTLFHATTSGQLVFYDADGRLLFSGGITASRGHEGDNAGLLAVMDMLRNKRSVIEKTPVYGCPLFDPAEKCVSAKR